MPRGTRYWGRPRSTRTLSVPSGRRFTVASRVADVSAQVAIVSLADPKIELLRCGLTSRGRLKGWILRSLITTHSCAVLTER